MIFELQVGVPNIFYSLTSFSISGVSKSDGLLQTRLGVFPQIFDRLAFSAINCNTHKDMTKCNKILII